mmetsp:Transcript_21897/g.32474  ORF Transcript_21897/g.32474 Transcript_21897/m.32474 type:complete len:89 (-) Transcript_21897:121-387(-)
MWSISEGRLCLMIGGAMFMHGSLSITPEVLSDTYWCKEKVLVLVFRLCNFKLLSPETRCWHLPVNRQIQNGLSAFSICKPTRISFGRA